MREFLTTTLMFKQNVWRVQSEQSVRICGAEIRTKPWRVRASCRVSGLHWKRSQSSPIVMPQTKCLERVQVAKKTMFWKKIGETSDEVESWRARRGNFLGGKRATPPTHTPKVGSEMHVAVSYEVVTKQTTETNVPWNTTNGWTRGDLPITPNSRDRNHPRDHRS